MEIYHIAFLTPEYPHDMSTPSGGLGTSIRNLANSLRENNWKVSIFIYDQNVTKITENENITLHFIKKKKFKILGWYLNRKQIEKYVKKFIKQENIDLIEVPDWTGISAFMNFSIPLVTRCNGSDTYFCHLNNRKQKFKNFLFEKLSFHKSDKVVSVSKFTADVSKMLFNYEKSIEIIPNSINTDLFHPIQVKTNCENKKTLLYFGTFIRKKGVIELSHIFNKIVHSYPNIELKIVGKDVIDNIENISTLEIFYGLLNTEAKEKVKYYESIPYQKIKDLLHNSSIVILPSFAEALPMTWLEAMSMEKTLVTSNIGWAKEIMIDGETGYIEDPKNHDAYTDKVIYLLKNPELAEKFGKAARKRVEEKFSTNVVTAHNMEFYKKTINQI